MKKKNRQDENLHTIEQIKTMGHYICTRKGDEGLTTQRGSTFTKWIEKEEGLYEPVHARTVFL